MQTESTTKKPNPAPPDRWLRNFLPMWVGQAVSMLGSWLVQFALVWYLTEETGSASILATSTAVALLPGVILGPFAGALVDRWNRKVTMVLSDLGVALATVILMLLFWTGLIQVWHIYAALFVRSLAGIFQNPAMSASTTLMVPQEHYTRLGGANQALQGILNVISPPLGALLLGILPIQGVLAIDVVTAAIAIAMLIVLVKVPQPERSDGELKVTGKQVITDVTQGFKYIISWPGIFMVIVGGALINMTASPAFSLMPLYVTQHLGREVTALGWLEAAFGVGTIAGGLLLSVWGGFKRKIITMMCGVAGMGVGILLLGLIPGKAYIAIMIFMGLTGLMNAFSNGPLGALLQAKIPAEIQGRVFAAFSSLIMIASPVGMLLAAPVADRFGVAAMYTISGVVCLLFGLTGLLVKKVATLDLQEPGGAIPAATLPAEPASNATS